MAQKPARGQAVGGLFAALLYGGMSVAMAFVNKRVLVLFPFANTFLALQMALTLALLLAASRLRLVQVRSWEGRTARALLPLVLCYNANVAFALASLRALNIPMYVTLKRLTPMLVLLHAFLAGKGRPPLQVALSVALTVSGCVIAGVGDLSFDPAGYAMALTSCCLQAGYLILVERSGAEAGLSSNELLLYNAALSLPVLLLLLLLSGEAAAAAPILFKQLASSGSFLLALTVALLLGSLLNFTLFLCTLVNDALTTTIVGVLKGVVSTVLGFFLLGGVDVSFLNIVGIALNTAGGTWYSFAKYRAKTDRRKPPSSPIDSQEVLPVSSTSRN